MTHVLEQIQIRAGAIGDQRLLADLCALVQELHVHAWPNVFKPTLIGALEEWFKDTLRTKGVKTWICQVAGLPAGYVLVRDQQRSEDAFCHRRRWYEIEQISVRPEYQRQGVAKALLGQVIASATGNNVNDIELNTWSFNQAAQRAFRKLGLAKRSVRLGLTISAV